MAKRIRLGIVGLDHWYAGLEVAEQAARSDAVELVQIAHRDEKQGRETVERFGGSFTTDYEAVASRTDLDVVATACYCSENEHLVGMAAKAGSHIVSVKPIAMNTTQAHSIAASVKAAGVRFVSFESNYRIGPLWIEVKKWIEEGRIGRVVSAATVLRSPMPTTPWPGEQGRTWWLDATKSPGGGWIDHAIYHIDALRWLLGDEVESIGGVVGNVKHKDIGSLEDYGLATARFRKGAIASIEVTWTGGTGTSLHRIELTGTDGQIVWDPTVSGKVALVGKTDPGGWLLTAPPTRGGSTLAHLVESLARGQDTAGGVDDACTNLAVCETFYRAAGRHGTLKV